MPCLRANWGDVSERGEDTEDICRSCVIISQREEGKGFNKFCYAGP